MRAGRTKEDAPMLVKIRKSWELPDSAATDEAVFRDRRRLVKAMGLGSLVSSLIVVLLLRSFAGLLITGLGPVIGLLWSMGGLGWAGVPIDLISSTMPTILLVVGFTDAVHLALEFRSLVRGGADPRSAGFCESGRSGGSSSPSPAPSSDLLSPAPPVRA